MDSQSYYSPKLLDHYQNPRNVGVLPNADGSAERENQVCGDLLQVFIRLEKRTVREARFKAEGCIPTIALASYATEWVVGKTVDETRQLNPAHFTSALGPLPEHKRHAALLVAETFSAAAAAASPK